MTTTFNTADLHALEREIATEHCRVVIECYARWTPSSYPMPVYDVSELEDVGCREPDMQDSNRLELQRAVRYLDMREQLVRPIQEQPQFVSFKQGAA